MIFNEMSESVKDILAKIYQQPFNMQLAEGTLSKDKYLNYLIQDSLYLTDYAKALAITASRLSSNHHCQQYLQFSLDTIKAEREHHYHFIQKHVSNMMINFTQNKACFMYTNYLLKTASLDSVEEAVASLLPCFWIYREVGCHIKNIKSINNPYDEWIALYSSVAFNDSVETAIEVTNYLGENASISSRKKMIAAFIRSTQLEWLFWDNAYHHESWIG